MPSYRITLTQIHTSYISTHSDIRRMAGWSGPYASAFWSSSLSKTLTPGHIVLLTLHPALGDAADLTKVASTGTDSCTADGFELSGWNVGGSVSAECRAEAVAAGCDVEVVVTREEELGTRRLESNADLRRPVVGLALVSLTEARVDCPTARRGDEDPSNLSLYWEFFSFAFCLDVLNMSST